MQTISGGEMHYNYVVCVVALGEVLIYVLSVCSVLVNVIHS